MSKAIRLWVVAVATLISLSASGNERVALFPLEIVSVDDGTAQAISRSLEDELRTKGYVVVKSTDGLEIEDASGPAAAESEGEAADIPTEPEGEPSAASDTTTTSPAAQAASLDCRYYITGSIVQLGQQISLALELQNTDSGLVSAKKVVARHQNELPKAVQTIAAHMSHDLNQHAASAYAPPPPPPPARPDKQHDPAPAPAAPSVSKNFDKNFGLAIGQAFSLKDEMYSFTSFSFNGRFEFGQHILLATTAGFAMGNKNFEDGFHFNLDLSLAGYLTKTQVAPYLGAGIGLFVGNKLAHCDDEENDDEYTYDYFDESSCHEEDALVGWEVFPVVGLEVLRTFPIRLHVEARYLVTFNAYKDWGHGPMLMIGVAF